MKNNQATHQECSTWNILGGRPPSEQKTHYRLNRIVHGNCFEELQKIPNEWVDLIVCDGPYGIGKGFGWDGVKSIQEFNLNLLGQFAPKLKQGGVLYLFGKDFALDCVDFSGHLHLKSRIIWYQPSRLSQGKKTYTNNYDVIFYFTKGSHAKTFNLDNIRVPQLVELVHRKRCEQVPSVVNGKYGKTAFNDRGKNPGDVWGDIKQLTYKSKELVSRKALNTIQKPLKLIERLVLASSNPGDVVLDPFLGTGTTAVACQRLNRHYIGFELNKENVATATKRLRNVATQRQSP